MMRTTPATTEARGMGPLPRLVIEAEGEERLLDLLRRAELPPAVLDDPRLRIPLADMVGLDVCLAVMDVYLAEFGDSKYRACPLLKEMVAAGHLGRKTGRGVYSY